MSVCPRIIYNTSDWAIFSDWDFTQTRQIWYWLDEGHASYDNFLCHGKFSIISAKGTTCLFHDHSATVDRASQVKVKKRTNLCLFAESTNLIAFMWFLCVWVCMCAVVGCNLSVIFCDEKNQTSIVEFLKLRDNVNALLCKDRIYLDSLHCHM